MKTLYDILMVASDATADEIKSAYRSLAQKYHPDKDDGDAGLFAEIANAYATLSDPTDRNNYDTFGVANDPINRKLTELFTAFINDGQYSLNIVDECNRMIRATQENVMKQIELKKSLISKLEKVRDRVTTESGFNLWRNLVQGKIDLLATVLDQGEKDLNILNAVAEKMSSYSDNRPVSSPSNWVSVDTSP